MAEPIRKITIVGGGTAGWLSATMLNSLLKRRSGGGAQLDITLIESPNIPTVGVGEATVPGMPRTLQQAGISESDFMKACNASFKLGVLFDHWNVDREGKPVAYVNPFSRAPAIDGYDAAYYFLKYGAGNLDYVQTFSPCVDLGRKGQGPRPLDAKEFDNEIGFAYHLDAGKFARMMRDAGIANGITHILDDMERVELDEDGYVAAVHLKEHGRHEVELVIDCTGFRGLIINEALGVDFVNYSDYLANDRAMAVQVQHPEGAKLEPMTRSTALGAGWTWKVPLYNRIGTGYVFSSAHRTDDQARDEFMKWLGPLGKDAEPRVIPMRVGRTRQAWAKNCIAVGLSGGFIEPLESTAIHMIDTSIRWLITYFPDTSYQPPLRDRYNKLIGKLYDEVRDFICLHYALGNRTDDQYWIDARTELSVPDSLAENLELWRHSLPGAYDLDFVSLFSPWTYQAVLLGKRVYETGYAAENFLDKISLNPDRWQAFVARMRQQVKGSMQKTADHRALLDVLRGDREPTPMAKPAQPVPPWMQQGPATVRMPTKKAASPSGIDFSKVVAASEDGGEDEVSLL